ncbi:MAG TPA: hypothetical protein VJB65_02740 [Patescibacteria group bacterium]|nr:hypothetical protein [Patescibacteria group bacterium]
MLSHFIKKYILKNFLAIDLSGVEKTITDDSIAVKYVPAIRGALFISALMIPAILFLPTGTLMNVLIPVTMVTGTAWFAVSLANIRKKFESFGIELTMQMFRSFTASLLILGLLTLFSLLTNIFAPLISWGQGKPLLQILATFLGIGGVFTILWDVFAGALKYDINDAMLTGQSEAAEKFFKKSLSLLYSSAENLRNGKGLEVANYYLGLSFFEIFSFIKATGVLNGHLQALMDKALHLKHHPAMPQAEADTISLHLIEKFIEYCVNAEGEKSEKSFNNIKDEYESLKNENEPQAIVDTRLSIIFEEIAELLELQGEGLFKKAS